MESSEDIAFPRGGTRDLYATVGPSLESSDMSAGFAIPIPFPRVDVDISGQWRSYGAQLQGHYSQLKSANSQIQSRCNRSWAHYRNFA